MTPSQKGALGEAAITTMLIRQGLSVFAEVGNHSRVDLVAMDDNGHLYKVQCKATVSQGGKASISLRKCNLAQKYNYHYGCTDFDVLAVYVIDWDIVAFISAQSIFSLQDKVDSITLRKSITKQNQHAPLIITDHLEFPRFS